MTDQKQQRIPKNIGLGMGLSAWVSDMGVRFDGYTETGEPVTLFMVPESAKRLAQLIDEEIGGVDRIATAVYGAGYGNGTEGLPS
jgi:hypothetical protein